MKFMVASHRGTTRLTSKLLVLGLCLGFHTGHLRAQTEETPTAAGSENNAQEEGTVGKIKETIEEIKKSRVKNRKETTDAVIERRGKDPDEGKYILAGEAQTLPEKVVRFVYAFRNVAGNQTIEKGGNKKDIGIDAVVNASAYAFQYGLTDKLSLAIMIPTITSNSVTINAYKFRESKIYAEKYKLVMDAVVPALIEKKLCTDEAECLNKINNENFAIGVNTDVVLPTGEKLTVKGGTAIRQAADGVVAGFAEPKPGKTGIGDTLIGALYNVYSTKSQMFSVGAGFLLPTGKGDDEMSYNRTGSGATSLGIALKYDYRVIEPLILSFSNQTDFIVKKAKWKRHSIIDPNELNTADTNTKGDDVGAAGGDGDGVSNNFTVTRKVPENTGFLRAGYALGDLHPMLSSLSVLGYFNWAFSPEIFYDNLSQQDQSKSTGISYALNFDGLGLQPRLPIGLSISQDRILSGDNVTLAAVNTNINLVLLYKF